MKDWSRKFYSIDKNFPDASKSKTAKEAWNSTLELDPSLGEFSKSVPTSESISSNQALLAQSEFVKPYLSDDYPEMEYLGDPRGAPTGPTSAGPVFTVFAVEAATCEGDFNLFLLTFSHLATNVEIVIPVDDPLVSLVQEDPPGWNRIQVLTPETPAYDGIPVQFKATMVDGLTGKIGTALSPMLALRYVSATGCPTLWLLIEIVGTGWTRWILWDYVRGIVPADIPKRGGGFCVFPCEWDDMADAVANLNVASWVEALHYGPPETPTPLSSALPVFPPNALPVPIVDPPGLGETKTNDNWLNSVDMTPWPLAEESWYYNQVTCLLGDGSEFTIYESQGPLTFGYLLNQFSGSYWNRSLVFGIDMGSVTDIVSLTGTYSNRYRYWRRQLPWSGPPKKCVSWGNTLLQADLFEDERSDSMFGSMLIVPGSYDPFYPYYEKPTAGIWAAITTTNLDWPNHIKPVKQPEAFGFIAYSNFSGADLIPYPGELGSPPFYTQRGHESVWPIQNEAPSYGFLCRISTYYAPVGSAFLYEDAGIVKIGTIDIQDLNRNHYLEDMVEECVEDIAGPGTSQKIQINGSIRLGTITAP